MKVWTVVAAAVLAVALVAVGAAAGQPAASEQAQTTVVGVSLFAKSIRLSKSVVPTGTVVFRVVNKSKVKHRFRVAGRTTPLLRPGQKATLKVRFTKSGRVTLACAIPAHRRKGMVRRLTVTAPVAQQTVVAVSMFEMGFKLSRTTVPPGTVEFRVVNDGKLPHDFRVSGKGTPVFAGGQRATLRVSFPNPGTYTFVCTVEGHAAAGMVGKLIVR